MVGGGLIGAAAAWHLTRRKTATAGAARRVALFERFDLHHTRGSSHGAARIFRVPYDVEEYVRLAEESIPLWREVETALGKELSTTTGSFDFGTPESLAPLTHALSQAGVSFQCLAQTQMTQRFSAYSLPKNWEALYQPDGGVLQADACRLGLIELARRAGAEVMPQVQVRALLPESGSVTVDTTAGRWRADQVVVAAGAWSNQLLAPLGLAIPLKVTREHVAYYAYRERSRFLPFNWHAATGVITFYGLPNGTRDEAKVGKNASGPETDPDLAGTVEWERLEPVKRFVHDHLPTLAKEPLSAETCLYASTPDDDFVLDRIGQVVLGIGFGGHGFKFGPLIGSMLADLVEGRARVNPHFAYARFRRS